MKNKSIDLRNQKKEKENVEEQKLKIRNPFVFVSEVSGKTFVI